jgi:alkaline phosphatase
VRATIEHLKAIGELENTLVIVTADHGHGFDVFGGVDTKYLSSEATYREKRRAVGVYLNAGLSQYTVPVEGVSYGTGPNFPANWDPRYTFAQGLGASPDHRENFRVHKDGPRLPATGSDANNLFANSADNSDGFVVNGTLPTNEAQGVHSLTDVAVFAMGPCQETFGGVYGNIDIFYKIANCLGLARPDGKRPR